MDKFIKPWISGIVDNLMATKLVLDTNIEHRNRIALIVLDNALEIAFKDYLSKVKKLQDENKDLLEIIDCQKNKRYWQYERCFK